MLCYLAASFTKLAAPADGEMVTSIFQVERGAAGLLALFCLVGFFQNFGPNTTTFVIPGELFPTRYRSTGHGISAASGKVGAIVSQFALTRIRETQNMCVFNHPDMLVWLLNDHGDRLWSYLPFTVTGFLATFVLPETRRTTLEDNSNEDQEGFIKGAFEIRLPRNPGI